MRIGVIGFFVASLAMAGSLVDKREAYHHIGKKVEGRWAVNEELSQHLWPDSIDKYTWSVIEFESNEGALAAFDAALDVVDDELPVYSAGKLNFKVNGRNMSTDYALTHLNQADAILLLDPHNAGNAQSFQITMLKSKFSARDMLIIGGDRFNEQMIVYKREG